jgi:hypothetical protein
MERRLLDLRFEEKHMRDFSSHFAEPIFKHITYVYYKNVGIAYT